MPASPVAVARRLLVEAVDALAAAVESGATSDAELLSVLTVCEGSTRKLDKLGVDAGGAQRRGVFAERGYRSSAAALSDLLGWERFEARRRVAAADHVCARIGLDGSTLPARLPATAAAFAAGRVGLRQVEVIAALLESPAACRLAPQVWAGAEAVLADRAAEYTGSQLQSWGAELIDKLDADGPEPDDQPPPERVNELHAAVVPIVMNGKGQPLDVGRATRTIPDGLRRAVAARDRGCAHCARPRPGARSTT